MIILSTAILTAFAIVIGVISLLVLGVIKLREIIRKHKKA